MGKKIKSVAEKLNDAGLQWFSALPYPQAIVIYRMNDLKALLKVFPDMKNPKDKPRGRCTEYVIDGCCCILIGLRDDAGFNTVAHECIHARSYIYSSLGVKVDFDNDEHEAYFMGMLAEGVVMSARELGLVL